jgi:hypothetical protein
LKQAIKEVRYRQEHVILCSLHDSEEPLQFA